MRVNYVKAARKGKDGKVLRCGRCGDTIEPGQPYAWAKGRYTSKMVRCDKSSCGFKRSELTGSDKKARVIAACEALEDFLVELADADPAELDGSSIEDRVSEIGGDVREVADEYRSAADEYFSGGGPNAEAADEIEQWADAFDNFTIEDKPEADELPEDDPDDVDAGEEAEEGEADAELTEWHEGVKTALEDLIGECPW